MYVSPEERGWAQKKWHFHAYLPSAWLVLRARLALALFSWKRKDIVSVPHAKTVRMIYLGNVYRCYINFCIMTWLAYSCLQALIALERVESQDFQRQLAKQERCLLIIKFNIFWIQLFSATNWLYYVSWNSDSFYICGNFMESEKMGMWLTKNWLISD